MIFWCYFIGWLVVWIINITSDFDTHILASLLILVGAIYALTWRIRRNKAGGILLVLEQTTPAINSFFILLSKCMITLLLINIIILIIVSVVQKSYEFLFDYIFQITELIGINIFFMSLFLSRKQIELREKGICQSIFVCQWKQIKAYYWRENMLDLPIKSHWIALKHFQIKVSTTNRERVEQILSQYLPANSNLITIAPKTPPNRLRQ